LIWNKTRENERKLPINKQRQKQLEAKLRLEKEREEALNNTNNQIEE